MTYAPATILALRQYLKGHDEDLSNPEVGIVGGPSHVLQGTSYHLGRDQLKANRDPYSARNPRDRAGLSNAASALDIDDDLDELAELSVWLVEQCRAGAPDTLDIREIIYSPDGAKVLRWDRERGQTAKPVPDSDLSHLTHTHISWYRDSEFRDKTNPFRRFFEGDDHMSEWSEKDPLGPDPDNNNRSPAAKQRDMYAGFYFGDRPVGNDGKPVGPEAWMVAQIKGLQKAVAALSTPEVDAVKLAVALRPILTEIVKHELDLLRLGRV